MREAGTSFLPMAYVSAPPCGKVYTSVPRVARQYKSIVLHVCKRQISRNYSYKKQCAKAAITETAHGHTQGFSNTRDSNEGTHTVR